MNTYLALVAIAGAITIPLDPIIIVMTYRFATTRVLAAPFGINPILLAIWISVATPLAFSAFWLSIRGTRIGKMIRSFASFVKFCLRAAFGV